MKPRRLHTGKKGTTLIEAVLAISVLAVCAPLVCLAMGESGKSGMDGAAETRCCWIIPLCREEMRAIRAGNSEWFSDVSPGESLSPAGEIRALAFGGDGGILGPVSRDSYETGTRGTGGGTAVYVVALPGDGVEGAPLMVEYPAAAPARRRTRISFPSSLP